MILRIIIIAFLILCTLGCKKDSVSNPISPETTPKDLSPTDTLEKLLIPGVKMTLSGLKDSYDISEVFSGQITLLNFADTSSFEVNFPFNPAYLMYVYDENNNFVGGGPEIVGGVGIDYELSLGQSYVTNVSWSKNTWANLPGTIPIPAIAGKYLCEFRLSGNSQFYDKYLYKWIVLTETGAQDAFAFQIENVSYNSVHV